jgi:HD-GYP domain-containing protein (c-di-GMP phosphodiesterase class II)
VKGDKIFHRLDPNNLRPGEEVNFSIYVKADNPGAAKEEYSLFCRRGEIFNPGLFAKIKFNYIQWVYYHRRDQENVKYYFNPDLTLIGDVQFLREKKRLGAIPIINKEIYFSLAVKNLHPGIKVPVDIFLKSKILGKRDYRYSIAVPKGDICQPAFLDNLNRKGIDYVYFRKQDEEEVFRYLYHNLGLIVKDETLPYNKKAELLYNIILLWTSRFYNEQYNKTVAELKTGFRLIEYLFSMLQQDKHSLQWLPRLRRHGEKLHAHCLNTCVLGMAFTKYLGWPKNQVIEFSQGALLHDLGMIDVPDALLNKPGRLSKAEMQLIKKHPEDSCRIIKEISSLSIDPMVMIFQHHEFGDGSGYLQGLKLPMIHQWARILRIIDSYEAMTSNRSWREKYDPLGALQEMRQEWSNKGIFDTNYLVAFIKFLSPK